jgi:16S rRNA (cytidine1402-2'-O)-methyltransferase
VPSSQCANSRGAADCGGNIGGQSCDGIRIHVHGTGADNNAEAAAAARFRAVPGTLYVVATPLGNLRDVTLRALDVLGSVDVVAAEDTRVTSVLLRHYGIVTRPVSLREHNEARRAGHIVDLLRSGKSIALVSDAGTPAVSDPGARLVRAVRDAALPVVPIPGANAAVAAVSAAGLAAERFVFLGFLPTAAKARRELLAHVARLPLALVIYEAPHRVASSVARLGEALGGERTLVVARELTKKFETIARLPLAEAPAWFAAEAHRDRGEFVLIVDAPASAAADELSTAISPEVDRWLTALVAELPPARAARVVAAATDIPRAVAYARALALKPGAGSDE